MTVNKAVMAKVSLLLRQPYEMQLFVKLNQGGHTMRVHPQNSDTANTFSTGILNKNESCNQNRFEFAKKMSLLLVFIFHWRKKIK
jgi:hypothetical protein